ncbi:hypothetical protein ALT1000_90113 [Alteromonas macleodii]
MSMRQLGNEDINGNMPETWSKTLPTNFCNQSWDCFRHHW